MELILRSLAISSVLCSIPLLFFLKDGNCLDLLFVIIAVASLIYYIILGYKIKKGDLQIAKLMAKFSSSRSVENILSFSNQEIRSIFVEKWNGEGLKKIDEGKEGILFETEFGKRVVKVINATAEQDGSYKVYWLRIPSHISNVKEAVAWTFGLNKDEYNPIKET